MALPELPIAPTRDQLVDLVSLLMSAHGDEADLDALVEYLGQHLPDPHWTDILYWPNHHRLARERDISDPSAAEVVSLAFEYSPIPL